jgi:hypothetical protein
MAKKKSHTPYNQLVDSLREVATTEAEMGHAPRQTVSDEPPPYPFVDGRVAEQAERPIGNEHPDVMDLTKSTKRRVRPLGKEGGTVAGKKGDRLNPNGDQDDDENGSVHPDQHMPVNSTAWHDVVRNNLDRRKRAERRDSGEGTNESIDEDVRQAILEEIEELVTSKESSVLVEEICDLLEEIQTLQAENEDLQKERDDLVDETLRQQLLLHIADFTKSMTLLQAEKFLNRAVDVVDMAKMSVDAQYLAKTLGRLKEEVVREGRRPCRAGIDITEGFADYESLRDERVAPITDAGMQRVVEAMKVFRK